MADDLLWTYCVLPADAPAPEGIDRVRAGGVAALVAPVPREEFGEEPLRRNLEDLGWLERVARSHEAVLEQALERSTIVPMRLCTLFEDEHGVRRMLEREQPALTRALRLLSGRQEWGVKVLVDRERLEHAARERSAEAARFEEQLDESTGGGAYLVRRRLERHLREVTRGLASELARDVHATLEDWAIGAVTRPPQNPELSGHEGEMLLNGAYLVDAARVDELRELVRRLEERHRDLGARIELTGPWPPYNFVPMA